MTIPSLEENATGQTQGEKERVFYARIKDLETINKYTVFEDQEQWEIKIPKSDLNQTSGRMRVRKTTYPDGRIEYVQTTKINRQDNRVGHSSCDETSVAVTSDVFDQFKRLATSGMNKRRFTIRCGNDEQGDSGDFQLEIDVFKLSEGRYANWCKIDYEYLPGQPDTPSYFPVGFEDVIPGDTQDSSDQAFIQQLYNEAFLLKNHE